MAMSFLPMILVLLGTSGSMNELIDLTDPQTYLQAKGVEYKVEAMLEVLAEPATKDLDQAKAQEMKKLQAMRALGSLKDEAAIPALQKAAAQKTLFFKECAEAAIAGIEGKPYKHPTASAEDLKKDLALLPPGIGLVMQARLEDGGPLALKEIVTEALKGIPDAPQPDEVLKEVDTQLSKALDTVGNVRLDAVTLGVSEDVGDNAGFVVIIGRGKYDHRTVESFLSEQRRTTHHEIGGTMFLGMDSDDVALAPVSNELMVFVSGPGWEQFPLEQVAAKLKERPAEPVFGDKLEKVLARTDQSSVLWGGGLISEGMKEVPPFAPYDEITLNTRTLEEGKVQMKLDGIGKDAKVIADSIAEMKQMVQQGIAEMEEDAFPGTGPVIKIMKGMRFYSMGLNGTISITLDGNPANIVSMMVPLLTARHKEVDHAVPPPPVPPPAPPRNP